ncbi:hypothetical protein KIN34_06250 [Cellulomonas sp. DKR-3]|uniref:Uncharacterized protein n=1 Tax=Cellulomonas fulva TaxID=2835530 RepID=A0ABS5TXK9_9CELL|nr:hypothetical protein [Cellulomonas fulva]MBT0993887.1 hypothetical protein [Cellulomonas fulva]
MTENEGTEVPTTAHVIPGGAPDPVKSTAPQAPPAPDDVEDVDAQLLEERPAVLPPAGPMTGVVPPPSATGR